MSLTREEILKVAKLSRLKFNEEEIQNFQIDLNNILEYIDMLNEVNTDGIEPLTQVNENYENSLREDEVQKSLTVEFAMKNAPEVIDGALVVAKMVGEN